ncbi:MAG TPA: ribosome biogenesis GTPase Der [Actinomycetota bacterium]|nr:ribosome biogenesis GTPase Der [Actinomycetota bacterium]
MPGDETYVDDFGGDESDLAGLARAAESVAAQEYSEAELEEPGRPTLPVVAVIGRPNVGKSTLVNRILGRREAVVQDVPGVTRDRVRYTGEWAGRDFQLVDTGGWEHDATGMRADIAAQARVAVDEADLVVFVVDATVGATDADERVVPILRAAGKPVVLAANKVDDAGTEADAAALWSLGLGEPYPVSALHGRGSGDLLDEIIARLPEQGSAEVIAGPPRVAIVGRPNVGKSSLLNKLAGQQRAVVDSVAGTTVDPVDELVTVGGEQWLFVDTAGIRRRVKEASGHEYYASIRTQRAIERAEVALVVIDASEPISEQDVRIIQMVVDAGRGLVIAFSKWDLMDDDRRRELAREIDLDLVGVPWAETVNISGKTGRGVDRVGKHLRTALTSWQTRVPTGRLNKFLAELVAAHPHPVRGGRQPRILFGTQAATRPPTFALFTTGFLEHGYRRFVERRLREDFGFVGTPMRINLRIRERRKRR